MEYFRRVGVDVAGMPIIPSAIDELADWLGDLDQWVDEAVDACARTNRALRVFMDIDGRNQ
jgi:hypothetical protein